MTTRLERADKAVISELNNPSLQITFGSCALMIAPFGVLYNRTRWSIAVDGLVICRGGIPASDLNSDCKVNLVDFSIFSEAWLSFCPDIFDPNTMDPNNIADPNTPCQLADIDNSWFVDPNDMAIMSSQWLINPPTQ